MQLRLTLAAEFLLSEVYVSTVCNYFWCYKRNVRVFFSDNNSSSLWIKKEKALKMCCKKVKDNLLSKKMI